MGKYSVSVRAYTLDLGSDEGPLRSFLMLEPLSYSGKSTYQRRFQFYSQLQVALQASSTVDSAF